MGQKVPVTGKPIIDAMTKSFDWLGKQINQVFTRPVEPPSQEPSNMTDKQLHAIYDVGAGLLNGLAPVIQESFVRHGSAIGERRFPHGMPVKVLGHVLAMVTEANDAPALALLGL